MLPYLLFSAIDRAEIVFHHLCNNTDGSSPLLLKHEIRHQQFSKSIQTFHTENVSITSHGNFTLQWGLLTIYFEKCQWPLGMPALPPLGEDIDRCISVKKSSQKDV